MDSLLEQAVETSYFKSDLIQIRSALWNNTLAVLVGSGFSRNANPEMPSWEEWASQLANKMELPEDVKKNVKAQDVPWLAGAYAERHSHAEMRNLLLSSMRGKELSRPELHEQLVYLPWADILTTNYDNFLEEAVRNAQINGNLNKEYNVVSSDQGLQLSRKEGARRIIKLHGCLKREEDCTITEEDYRTYRDKYAPFVNTVRQILLENHFCLIGYSATDPDFLDWIGWVRDKLGDQLKIYWLSKNQLSQDEIAIYKQRGIICISLDCFSHVNPFSVSVETSEVLDEYVGGSMTTFNSRHAGENSTENNEYYTTYANFLHWLSLTGKESIFPTTNQPIGAVSSEIETQVEASDLWSYPDIENMRLSRNEMTWDEIQDLVKRMKQGRESYPGWLLPPIKTLYRLWNLHTSVYSLMLNVKRMRPKVPDNELLEALHEACWLLDMANVPAFNKLDEVLEEILDAVLPYLRSTHKKGNKLQSQVDIQASMWANCALLLLRWTRQRRESLRFEKIAKSLKNLLRCFPNPEAAASLSYQRILQQLECFNRSGALRLLRRWKLTPSVSKIWFICKAMLLGELGDVQQGYALLRTHYDDLLTQVQNAGCAPENLSSARLAAESLHQFSLLAEKNWLIIPKRELKRNKGIPEVFQDALPSLGKKEPDILATLEKLQVDVTAATEAAQVVPSKILFETGERDTTMHAYSGMEPGFREAFLCSGAMEKLGRTPYIGYASFSIATWLKNAQLFFYLHRGLNDHSIRLLLRSSPGNTFKTGQDIFLQYDLAMLPEEWVHELTDQLHQGLQAILNKTTQDTLDERHARFAYELLSRLCVRVSLPEKQQELLDLALQWMEQGPAWRKINAFEQMFLFCHRAVSSASYSLINQYLERILSSPVLMGFTNLQEATRAFQYSNSPDIIVSLPHTLPGVEISAGLSRVASFLWQELQSYEITLLDSSIQPKNNFRQHILGRYYWRLLWMLQHNLVDEPTRRSMATYIWSGYEEHGLPELQGLREFSILDWPTPTGIKVAERYKTKLLEQVIPPAYTYTEDGRRSYGSYTAPLKEYLYIRDELRKRLELGYNEKLRILNICYSGSFWKEDIDIRMEHHLNQPFYSLAWILSYILGSSLKTLQGDAPWLPEWLDDLIVYGERINANCLRLKVLNILFKNSNDYVDELALELEEALYSDNSELQLESGVAVLLWRSEVEAQIPCDSLSLNFTCPDELCSAALRGFWLMGGEQATSLAAVLKEQFEYHRQLPLREKELNILLRALGNKLRMLSYERSTPISRMLEMDRLSDWVAAKESLNLLPEHRLAVAQLVNCICKVGLKLSNPDIVQQWLAEMRSDPLASTRREGESAE